MRNIDLYNGDCLEVIDKLIDEGVKVDVIITDPPYGVGFKNDFYDDSKESVFKLAHKWLSSMYKILNDGSHCYIFVPTIEIHKWIQESINAGFNFKNIITTKCKFSNPNNSNFKLNQQFILFLHKGKGSKFNKVDFQPTSECWLKDKRNKNKKPFTYQYTSNFSELDIFGTHLTNLTHPNQKNICLIEILIKLSSNEGDLVLEPFLGSGTTGVARKNTKRKFIGIELDKYYFDTAKERILKEV